ncbi:MAG: asparagine synthase (glutamine-hydrolyzing) [Saprospiraceae bacterium]
MCGIIGILSKDKHKHIKACNTMINHRGPDDEGLFIDGNLAFGHQRLSIIDLSENGHQPMQIDGGAVTMIFNGEIYNHMEIRASLKGNYKFKSSSDTETIIYAYKEFGTAVFAMLNGIFALAIFDKRSHQLIVARDHLGVKPLYYYHNEEDFFFGSEIKSFLKIPNWDKTIDNSALVNYLHFMWSPGEQTPFQHIKKLLPGHFISIDLNNIKTKNVEQFYDIPFDGTSIDMSESEWIEALDQKFSTAVERQLMSDVPVGFFLSGGLDSSIIVAKARELTDNKLQTFTIDTDLNKNDKEGFSNDLHYAKQVAKHLDVKLEIVPAQVDIVDDFDKMIWHMDEPQADAAPLNVLNISNIAKNMGYKVLLGGAGGDDLFSGYRRHQALSYEKYLDPIPKFMGSIANGFLAPFSSSNSTVRRAKKLLKDINQDQVNRIAGYYEWLPLDTNKRLFSKKNQKELRNYSPSDILINQLKHIPNESRLLNQLLYWDMKYFLTDHNLNYTDKLSMAEGVEVRVPFLDIDLVNFSTKVPTNLKMKGSTAKYLLKKVGEKYLPNDVIYRPKTGFGAPVRKWIVNDLDDMIHERLSPKKIRERGIFDEKQIWSLIEANKSGKIDASYPIWGLLSIESWMEQFS